jgi:epoxyqueuosine reductase
VTPRQLTEAILDLARSAGFPRAGVALAAPIQRSAYLRSWLERGLAGEMTYLARWADLREHPDRLLPGAKAVVVVADLYPRDITDCEPRTADSSEETNQHEAQASVHGRPDEAQPRGRVARYAWGRDYHKVLRRKLKRLADAMHREIEGVFETRVCVDTAPIVEREAAAAAGIGWIGKNTMVLHQEIGSYFFLGEIITTLELAPTEPAVDHCGTCTRCIEACPTEALIAPYQMDATRCISYLTIEHRGEISTELRPLMDDWVFGCDVCQEVCPYNQRDRAAGEPAYGPGGNPLTPSAPLAELINWSETDYRRGLTGSAMKRATLDMLQRNARIAAENASRVMRIAE